jgi:putative hemolysin
MEDLIEEVIGDIRDEVERDSDSISEAPGGVVTVMGSASLLELNDRFGLDLPAHEFTTVGGYIMGRLGRLAAPGDVVEFASGRFRVEGVSGRRIGAITLSLTAQDGHRPT